MGMNRDGFNRESSRNAGYHAVLQQRPERNITKCQQQMKGAEKGKSFFFTTKLT